MNKIDEKKGLQVEFSCPCSKYRGIPFWAWNTKMKREDVTFCLDVFEKMGMGGCFLHSRTGMSVPYLGDEFMDLIQYANEEAKKRGIKVWLYDEDRWPSGFAGGLVTRRQEYRARFLVWSPKKYEDGEVPKNLEYTSTAKAVRSGNRRLLAVYQIESQNGWMKSYNRLSDREGECRKTQGERWYAYLEISGDNLWFNGTSYVDTLNPKAIRYFLQITYNAYYNKLGKEFGKYIPGIFTDEPQFTPKERAVNIEAKKEVIMPFTDRLLKYYQEEYNGDLLDFLPELFYEMDETISKVRYRYHRLVSRMFAESYGWQIGEWCKTHGIDLCGHLMKEPLLSFQTQFIGEAMASYAGFQIPGIDMLCDRRELTTAKQAQSIVHQYGKKAMISELYGVTNWDYDFAGHKLQGDWQMALGVTLRAPHLAWTSMEGEAKRDYPASIFYQSPWYQEYKLIESYFARLSMILSRGHAVVKIGIIHPVESCWSVWGTMEKTGELVRELDRKFLYMTDLLLKNGLDFDFISEELLPGQLEKIDRNEIKIGEMTYSVILVPFMKTIRSSTADILNLFNKAGGQIIFCGEIPAYVDGCPSDICEKMAQKCLCIGDWEGKLTHILSPLKEAELYYEDGSGAEDFLMQIREEQDERWLFLAQKNLPQVKEVVNSKTLIVKIKGLWDCSIWDAMSGDVKTTEHWKAEKGVTIVRQKLYGHDSLLLHLKKIENERAEVSTEKYITLGAKEETIFEKVSVRLSEPNVLVLDIAEYSFDDEAFKGPEEILRIDDELREKLGFPKRMEAWPQPWVSISKENNSNGKLELRYYIESEVEIEKVTLALEQPEETTVFWNGRLVEQKINGWYVDRKILTIPLGKLQKGKNILCLERNFHQSSNLEQVFLLGDFGVQVFGNKAVVTEPVRDLYFGDWSKQGLAFYGGNVTYFITPERDGEAHIRINKFAAPLLRVDYKGEKVGIIAFAPYELTIPKIERGRGTIEITAYGNRINTFGALHNCNSGNKKASPDWWRSRGDEWSYEYCIQPSGILKAPIIEIC